MKAWERYFEVIDSVVADVRKTQGENIMKAANLCADSAAKGGIVYAYGSWHSLLIAEENYYRAASPANYCAIAEASINGTNQMTKLTAIEGCYGIGNAIVDYHRIDPKKDVLICISNGGNNTVTIDAALRAKEKGIPVIALTSVDYGNTLETTHKCGKKLKDVADVVIDNCCIIGDAALKLDGFPIKVGPVSGIPMNYIMSSILVEMSELLIERGITPEVYLNGHVDHMTEDAKRAAGWLADIDSKNHNNDLLDKYFYRIKSL